jgi:hypothetical protein
VLTENEVSAAPNPTMTATLWVAVREQEARGECGGSSRAREEQDEGEKREKRRRRGGAPFKWARWGGGRLGEGATQRQGVGGGHGGTDTAVGWRGVAGTDPEPVGGGVAARWAQATVAGSDI